MSSQTLDTDTMEKAITCLLDQIDELRASGGGGSSGNRKKVLVSGCFDLLHSGHVEFFQQAAKHGDLYVRLGTDANIWALKKHKTMYTDAERLYMVKHIDCVYDAAMSTGTGRYDFVSDMDVVKPDIYFCNEDASGLDGRYKICEERGIEIVCAPRDPAEGLAVRSSTSMKERLAEMVNQDEGKGADERQTCDMSAYNEIIPWRFCFAGGWMDLKWCNELYHGSVVTINIQFSPGICKDFCGLATSSRKHWRKLWNGKVPSHLEANQAAAYLYGVETFSYFGSETLSYSAGSQDHCGLMFPGINKLNYTGHHWPTSMIGLNDPSDPKQAAVFKWLEDVLYIMEIPFVSRPGNYNSQRVNNLIDESISREQRVAMVKAIADASELTWQGIISMDVDKLGKGLSDTMKAWEVALPYTVDPYKGDDAAKSAQLRDWWTKYDRPNTKGCLFSGAGGGFLMVINDKPVEGGMKIKLNHKHYCKPYPSDKLDSTPRPVPGSY